MFLASNKRLLSTLDVFVEVHNIDIAHEEFCHATILFSINE